MNQRDEELQGWSEVWKRVERDSKIDAPALRAEVRRRTRRFRGWLIFEMAFLSMVLIGLPIFAWWTRDVGDAALATVFCLLVVIGLIRNISMARSHWRPPSQTTRAFVDLMARRAAATRQQILFGWGALAVEVAVFIPWILHTLRRKHGAEMPLEASLRAWTHLVALVAVAAFVLFLMQRRNRADRRKWEQLNDQIRDSLNPVP